MRAAKKEWKHQPVVVVWKDATYRADDSDSSEKLLPDILYCIGWILEDTDEYLTIAQEYSKKDTWVRHRTTIPNELIQEIWELS